jgi:hypothetical protein
MRAGAGTPAAFTFAEHLAASDLEQRVVGFRLTARSRRWQRRVGFAMEAW